MKKYLIGFLAGVLFATAGTVMAEPVMKKITAHIRADYSVTMDGNPIELSNSPIVYEGSSYLPVREISVILDKEVGFDDGVIKLDTVYKDPAAELERLKKNLAIIQDSNKKTLETIAKDDSGEVKLTSGQRKLAEDTLKIERTAIEFNENKISSLLERFPELAE